MISQLNVNWATDIHFDHCKPKQIDEYLQKLCDTDVDALFITGDISTGHEIDQHLSLISKAAGEKPVFFVCGNHDFYYSSFANVRDKIVELSKVFTNLKYLSRSDFVMIKDKTAVVGHDGWYDMSVSSNPPSHLQFKMCDWDLIDDFAQHIFMQLISGNSTTGATIGMCSKLAHEATAHVVTSASNAISSGAEHVVVLTHVPLWESVHTYQNKPGEEDVHPYFTNEVMGKELTRLAGEHSNVQFTVFAGHTHGAARAKILPNLSCFVQAAEYGDPTFERVVIT